MKAPPDPRPGRRRRQACPPAYHAHRWSMVARAYMAGCLRLAACADGAELAELDALYDRLDALDRRMAERERAEVNAFLTRLQPPGGDP